MSISYYQELNHRKCELRHQDAVLDKQLGPCKLRGGMGTRRK